MWAGISADLIERRPGKWLPGGGWDGSAAMRDEIRGGRGGGGWDGMGWMN